MLTIARNNFAACLLAAVLAAPVFAASPVNAAPESEPAASEDAPANPTAKTSGTGAALQLNKLEAYEDGCRAYVVIDNESPEAYDVFKLDLVIFQTDGVIGKRFALDLAPLRASRKSVKIFEIAGTPCDKIGSFLINDVMECKTTSGVVDGCLGRLTTSTLSDVEISK